MSKKAKGRIKGERCPVCHKERMYRTKQGAKKGAGKPCISCSNSISRGGAGNVGICIDCNKEGVAEYSFSLCKGCHNKRSSEYHKNYYRFKKYGITKEDFDLMYNGYCDICCIPIEPDCHIDHCHKTGKVRGLLCNTCNKGLGLFKDSKVILREAIRYLEERG